MCTSGTIKCTKHILYYTHTPTQCILNDNVYLHSYWQLVPPNIHYKLLHDKEQPLYKKKCVCVCVCVLLLSVCECVCVWCACWGEPLLKNGRARALQTPSGISHAVATCCSTPRRALLQPWLLTFSFFFFWTCPQHFASVYSALLPPCCVLSTVFNLLSAYLILDSVFYSCYSLLLLSCITLVVQL